MIYLFLAHISLKKFCQCKICLTEDCLQFNLQRMEAVQKCNTCEKIFRYKSSLKRHQRNHGEHKQYACRICRKGFYRSDIMKIHEGRHANEIVNTQQNNESLVRVTRKYICGKCKRNFQNSFNRKFPINFHSANMVHLSSARNREDPTKKRIWMQPADEAYIW